MRLILLLWLALGAGALAAPDLSQELKAHVEYLGKTLGERNLPHYAQLQAAAGYLEAQLRQAGYQPRRQTYQQDERECSNLVAELRGGSSVVVLGAHYDSVEGAPGANDNGSGCAALLALARRLQGPWKKTRPTLRFVFFVNEEPPYFGTDRMGSYIYAGECQSRHETVLAMLSLETMGYYSDQKGSQKLPPGVGPFVEGGVTDVGDFIALVGDDRSRHLAARVEKAYHSLVPMRAVLAPDMLPGINWSDHWSFWEHGYPALMVTDTAPFRYPHYHTPEDTPDKLDYGRLAQVVQGLVGVVKELTR